MQIKERFHSCNDLGLWALDRGPSSCAHKTEYCSRKCYMNKLKVAYKGIAPRRLRDEEHWTTLDGATMRYWLARMATTNHGRSRFRGCTDGENFSDVSDAYRWAGIIRSNPATLFWLPTRGWRDSGLRTAITRLVRTLPNSRAMASLDPSNTPEEVDALVSEGWSTMFFGDDTASLQPSPIKCAKTWRGIHGHCRVCKVGCFKSSRVDVWLKEH